MSRRRELELERLARRIAWLDRFRRPLAIVLGVLLAPLILWWMFGWFPSNWPGFHIGALAIMTAAIAWYGLETFLGLLIAVWETDHAKLTRPAELPRAQLLDRASASPRAAASQIDRNDTSAR